MHLILVRLAALVIAAACSFCATRADAAASYVELPHVGGYGMNIWGPSLSAACASIENYETFFPNPYGYVIEGNHFWTSWDGSLCHMYFDAAHTQEWIALSNLGVSAPSGVALAPPMFTGNAYSVQCVTTPCTAGGAVGGAGGSGGTVSGAVEMKFPEVNHEDYEAVLTLFGVALAALVSVWGVASLIRFFSRSPDA